MPVDGRIYRREGLLKVRLLGIGTWCALLLACLGGVAFTQEGVQKPDAPAPQSTSRPPGPVKLGADFVQLLQRNSVVFPDLAVDTASLSTAQKFKLAANNSVSLSTVTAAALGSGWNQALNEPEGYGQGMSGYGKRFGSSMARSASNQIFGTFLLASVLHQDPRFFVKNDVSFGGSIKYSISRIFLTRGDDDGQQVNWSGLVAPLGAEALANTYLPPGERAAGDVLSRYGYDLAWKFAGNLAKQYWPKINKQLRLQPLAPDPKSPGGL
jgi:hypothetical protein